MKHKYWFLMMVFCFNQNVNANPSPERLHLITQEWFPYQFQKKGVIQGSGIEKLKCILKSMKQPYLFSMNQWNEAKNLLDQGSHHGFFLSQRNEKIDKYAVFSAPIIEEDWAWFSFSDLLDVSSLKFKSNTEITAIFGSKSWFWLIENGYRVSKKPRTVSAMLDLMIGGDARIIFGNEKLINEEIKKMELTYQVVSKVKAKSNPLGVYFSKNFIKKYPQFLTKFNNTIKSCK